MNMAVTIAQGDAQVRAARVAAIAAKHADAVDAEGRFPHEAVDAMRAEKLLSIQIPPEFGGEGATTTEIAELCSILGQACAASAMVFAMHQIKLSSLVAHGLGSEWHRAFAREIAARQLLLASSTPASCPLVQRVTLDLDAWRASLLKPAARAKREAALARLGLKLPAPCANVPAKIAALRLP